MMLQAAQAAYLRERHRENLKISGRSCGERSATSGDNDQGRDGREGMARPPPPATTVVLPQVRVLGEPVLRTALALRSTPSQDDAGRIVAAHCRALRGPAVVPEPASGLRERQQRPIRRAAEQGGNSETRHAPPGVHPPNTCGVADASSFFSAFDRTQLGDGPRPWSSALPRSAWPNTFQQNPPTTGATVVSTRAM